MGLEAAVVAESALRQHAFVKVIAGIASSDARRVRNFAWLYTMAGAHAIDLGCDPQVVFAARRGVEEALAAARRMGRPRPAPLLMVSVGLDCDPHVSAPLIDLSICAACGGCTIPELKQCASRPLESRHDECPSCYECVGACPHRAINLAPRSGLSRASLEAVRDAGADAVELHVSGAEPEVVVAAWRAVSDVFGTEAPVSFSLGSEVSSHAFVERQVEAIEDTSARFIIIQSEGRPASGRPGGGPTQVLPALALAARVLQKRRRAFAQLSGGADEQTGSLVKGLGLAIHGLAFGSCARAVVGPALAAPDLDDESAVFAPALAAARRLVESVGGPAAVGL